ncbi:hypothetical protein RCL1_008515 [Eukaryota sp. TZLM3-RCL]
MARSSQDFTEAINCFDLDLLKNAFLSGSSSPQYARLMMSTASNGFTPLHFAVSTNQIEIVSVFLNYLTRKPSSPSTKSRKSPHSTAFIGEPLDVIDAIDHSGMTALHIACIRGFDKIVVLLLNAGATSAVFDFDGFAPIHYSAIEGRTLVIHAMLSYPDVLLSLSDQTDLEDTPLHLAARYGHLGVLSELLKSETSLIDIDHTNSLGQTALHYACINSHSAIVKTLLHHGASVDASDRLLRHPLHYAAQKGSVEICRLLIEHDALVDVPDINHMTPISLAAGTDVSGSFHTLQYLIDSFLTTQRQTLAQIDSRRNSLNYGYSITPTPTYYSSNIDSETSSTTQSDSEAYQQQETPISTAQSHHVTFPHSPSASESTLSDTTSMSRPKFENNSTMTISNSDKSILSSLINVTDFLGASVLRHATLSGNINSVKLLIQYGADVNFFQPPLDPDDPPKTAVLPLSVACERGHFSIVKYLVEEAESDVCMEDYNGCTAAMFGSIGEVCSAHKIVKKSQAADVADDVIRSKFGVMRLSCQSEACSLRCLRYLHSKGLSLSQADHEGVTPLHMACGKGRLEIVSWLISIGVDVNCQQSLGDTPLCYAAMSDQSNMIDLLVDCSTVDINHVNHNGDSPLSISVQEGCFEAFKSLLDHGADDSFKNSTGQSLLHIAVEHNRETIVESLLSRSTVDPLTVDSSKQTALHRAASLGLLHVSSTILSAIQSSRVKIDLSSIVDDKNWTPLHYSVEAKTIALARLLLDTGFSPNAGATSSPAQKSKNIDPLKLISLFKNKQWQFIIKTPIHLACCLGISDLLSLLLNYSGDPNIPGHFSTSLLHMAVASDNLSTLKTVLCCFNITDYPSETSSTSILTKPSNGGVSPLELGLEVGAQNCVRLLSVYIKIHCSTVPLSVKDDHVCPADHSEISDDYSNVMDVPFSPIADPIKALFVAIVKGHDTMVSVTLSQYVPKGMDLNQLSPKWQLFLPDLLIDSNLALTPLHVAAASQSNNSSKVIRQLVQHSASTTSVTEICLAVTSDSSCSSGVNNALSDSSSPTSSFNQLPRKSWTLMSPTGNTQNKSKKSLKITTDRSNFAPFFVDKCKAGETPLQLALRCLNEFAVKTILSFGSSLIDSEGNSVVDCLYSFSPFLSSNLKINSQILAKPKLSCKDLIESGHEISDLRHNILTLITSFGAHCDLHTIFRALSCGCSTSELSTLLSCLLPIPISSISSFITNNASNCAYYACLGGNPEIISHLFGRYKIPIEILLPSLRKPLHFLVLRGHFAAIKALPECQVMSFDCLGLTPLHLAALIPGPFSGEIISHLVKNSPPGIIDVPITTRKNRGLTLEVPSSGPSNLSDFVLNSASTPLHLSLLIGNLVATQNLIGLGASLVSGLNGISVLHFAACSGSKRRLVSSLLENFDDLKISGTLGIVKLLLSKGIASALPVGSFDIQKRNPLHYLVLTNSEIFNFSKFQLENSLVALGSPKSRARPALGSKFHVFVQVCEIMVSQGRVDPYQRDDNGRTPLSYMPADQASDLSRQLGLRESAAVSKTNQVKQVTSERRSSYTASHQLSMNDGDSCCCVVL